jgi:hypothetical protein
MPILFLLKRLEKSHEQFFGIVVSGVSVCFDVDCFCSFAYAEQAANIG